MAATPSAHASMADDHRHEGIEIRLRGHDRELGEVKDQVKDLSKKHDRLILLVLGTFLSATASLGVGLLTLFLRGAIH